MPYFTTDFQPVPASAILVGGRPAGEVVTSRVPLKTLSSLAGLFSVSTDTAILIDSLCRMEMPRRLAA